LEVKQDNELERRSKNADADLTKSKANLNGCQKALKKAKALNAGDTNVSLAMGAVEAAKEKLRVDERRCENADRRIDEMKDERWNEKAKSHEEAKHKASVIRQEQSELNATVVRLEKEFAKSDSVLRWAQENQVAGNKSDNETRVHIREDTDKMDLAMRSSEEARNNAEEMLRKYETENGELKKQYDATYNKWKKVKKAKLFLCEALGIEDNIDKAKHVEKVQRKDLAQQQLTQFPPILSSSTFPAIKKRGPPPVKPSHRSCSSMTFSKHSSMCKCGTCSLRPYSYHWIRPPPTPPPESEPPTKPPYEITRLYDASPYTRDLILRQQGRLKAKATSAAGR